jgi:hypothetical protein
MTHRMSENRITARLVTSPYWDKGQRASLSGALAGTALLELQFLQDDKNIAGTRLWAIAPQLIAHETVLNFVFFVTKLERGHFYCPLTLALEAEMTKTSTIQISLLNDSSR